IHIDNKRERKEKKKVEHDWITTIQFQLVLWMPPHPSCPLRFCCVETKPTKADGKESAKTGGKESAKTDGKESAKTDEKTDEKETAKTDEKETAKTDENETVKTDEKESRI